MFFRYVNSVTFLKFLVYSAKVNSTVQKWVPTYGKTVGDLETTKISKSTVKYDSCLVQDIRPKTDGDSLQ
jgi:hypothetical protein